MVCSQMYSQNPSQCELSNVHQHRSGVPNSAEVYCLEPETSEGNWLGSTVRDANLWASKGNSCSGSANTSSPFKSSWIQRLIPSHSTRLEHLQLAENFLHENHGIDGVQIGCKESPPLIRTQSDFLLFENSRRSKQDFFSGHRDCLGSNTMCGPHSSVNMAATSRLFEPSEVMRPEVHVSPQPLPVVESLLLGSSKKILDNQTLTETTGSHILSKCTGFSNQINQTVRFSADERSRVFCSSIEGLNSRSAAKDLLALKSMQGGKRGFNASQVKSEFSLNSAHAVSRSNLDSIYGGKDCLTRTNLSRTYMNPPQIEDPFIALHTENRYPLSHVNWASSTARCESVENRLIDAHAMPYRADGIEPIPKCSAQTNCLALKADERLCNAENRTCLKTMNNRDCWHAKEHHNYEDGASFTSEALNERGGAFNGGRSIPNLGKDGPQHVSDLVFPHHGANVAKERAGISLSHHMMEQKLSLSHDSGEEQGGTSRSFSFHFADRFSYDPQHARVVTGKGHWPFCPTTSSEDLVHSRWLEDSRTRDVAQATRPNFSLEDSSTFREQGVHNAGPVYMSRSRCSPFFGTENLMESAKHRLSVRDEISPSKASCIDIKEVFLGKKNKESLHGNGVDQAEKARSLKGGQQIFSRSESDLMIEEMEGKELKYSHPLRTVSVDNWKGFKPSIRSSTRTFAPVGAELKQANGNVCYRTGSIGSCSKRPANLCTEDPSTTVEARSRHTTDGKPEALTSSVVRTHLYSSQTQSAGTGRNVAPDGRESEGKEAVGLEGSVLKQNMWLQRWSTTGSRKNHVVSKPFRERGVFTGMDHIRNFVEKDYSTSQGSRESSHHFDFRSHKRVCYEKRSGLQSEPGKAISKIGSVAVARESGIASHFMKRFSTPSAAAMAIMGMTARKVHSTQPQRRGLFGVWASSASIRKPPAAPTDICKNFLTRPKSRKEVLQSAAKPSPTPVDA